MSPTVSPEDDPSSGRAADPNRLRALARYDILDTPPSETFDRISDLAAGLFDAPIGLITFVEADRQWHKACVGFDVPELDLDTSFCVHTLGDAQQLVVEDATDDDRFVNNPLVTGDRHIRFYAGSPMTTPDGHVLGTVCVLDTEPRSPSEQKLERLDHLAQMAVDRLEERRRHKIEAAGADASLDATDTRLNELLSALGDVVWEARIYPAGPTDADPVRSEILYTNSSEERVYGRPTGAFVQDPMLWRSAAHPEDEANLPTIETLLADGQWSGEYRLLQPNGTARWVETSIHVVGQPAPPDEPGDTPGPKSLERPFKLAGITRDIHRRKQAEASVRVQEDALEHEKERLQLALEAAGAGVFEWSIPEDDRVWDEAVQQMFGLDGPPRSTGELLEQVHPDDRSHLQEAMGAVLGDPDKQGCQVEYRVPGPDGADRYLRAHGMVARNDEGEATKMTGLYQDRTETMKRRHELRRNERRFEAIFQDPDLLTGLLDLDGTLRRINDTALSFIEADRRDVVGTPFWDTPWWTHDATLQADLREWIERAAAGEYVSYQSDHITGEGRMLIVRGSIRPVTREDGTVTSLIVSARDVTRREDQRRELETLHEAIEDAADGVAILFDGEYVYVDQTHVDLYGFGEKEQLLGESWRMLYDENEIQRLEETVFPVLQEEGYWQGYVTGSRPDGSTFPAELSLTLSGENQLVCTVRDMTERRKQERRRELLLNASETGIAEWSPQTGDVHWDETLRTVFGRAPKTLGAFADLVHPDDLEYVEERLEAVLDDNTSWSGEFRIEDGQDRMRWIRTLVIPVHEGNGTTRILATGKDITEQKERARELCLKERAMDEANVGIQITDATGDDNPLVYVNEGFEAMTGYARDEVLGRNPRLLQGPETDPDTIQTLRSAIDADEPVTVEIQNYRKDGTPYWERLSVTPVYDEDGALQNYIGIQQDITDRRRRTEALEERQRKLDLVLSGTETGIAEWDLQTNEVHWDSILQRVYGRSSPRTFEEFRELVHPEDSGQVEEALETMIETGNPWYGEFRVEAGAGGFVWLEARVTPVYEGDTPVKAFATVTNITERKEQERRLRMLSAAVEQATEAVLITEGGRPGDATLEVKYVNEAYEEMTGWSAEEIIGGTPRVLQGLNTERDVLETLRAALGAGEEWQGETINYKKDGESYRAQWSVSPVIGADGEIEHWVSVQRDVTEERERERALERANQRFERFAEAVPDAFFIASADYKEMLYHNSAAESLYGVDASVLAEDPGAWTRHVHPADLPDLQAAMGTEGKDGAQGGAETAWPQHQEFRIQHPTQGQRWLSVSLHALESDTNSAPERIAGVATDITERKKRERRLQALHQATRNLIDPNTEAEAAQIVTSTLGEALGLEEAAVYLRDGDVLVRAGTADGKAVGPMPRIEKGYTPLWTVLEKGKPQIYADPSVIDDEVDRSSLSACAYVPLDDDGALAVGTADPGRLDESEIQFIETIARSLRKVLSELRWERDLTESERRYRTLAENIPNGAVLLFDGRLRYTLAAGELIGTYGLDESDFIGRQAGTVLDIGPDEAEHPLVERYRAALEGDRTDRRIKIKGRTLRIHIVPLLGQSESEGLLLVQDVTEGARRERQLVKAKETAEAADEMKSALLANMSHEIRTPLTSILGFAEVIGEEADPDDDAVHFAGLIERGGRRLMNTLDSVLNLSKLEGGGRTLSAEPINLTAEARPIVGDLQSAADEKGIALHVEMGETPVWARADAGGVELVARNLIQNAIKYTEGGGEVA
ncbi:MAG: PAS domain S-box protein, partial [Salinibacter sp.]